MITRLLSRIRTPSVFSADRYAIAQVALYIFAVTFGVVSAFQLATAFGAPENSIPKGGSRLVIYVVPAIHNLFQSVAMVYLSIKLQTDRTDVVWKICAGVMVLEILVTICQVLAQPNLMPILILTVAAFGLGSLLVGREGNEVDEYPDHHE